MIDGRRSPTYIYTFASHEDERPLCILELRSLFGVDSCVNYLESSIGVDPSRSPFIKLQLAVMYEGAALLDLTNQLEQLQLNTATYKVVYIETDHKVLYNEKREMERVVGAHIRAKADMRQPDRLYGLTQMRGRWFFGECRYNQAVWLEHKNKPQNYSTALSTRVARAVVNIAVPDPKGIRAIDPCCGIGTVLIEALSMGIDIIGCDINPMAIRGARMNLKHFGFPDAVTVSNMHTITGSYDAAIVDLPYNLCSKITLEEQLQLLKSVRGFASKTIIITVDTIDSIIENAGFTIIDRCPIKKGSFTRQIMVCV